jgi:2-oxoisovalerate dehydrogenase E1 component beta subunit
MATLTLLQALNQTLHAEMERDDRVVVLGEDVGKVGGVFRVTEGLQEKFGEDRVIDTPLAENGIIGAAIGMALYGLRPIPEIQFVDFIYPAFDQIVSELAKFRFRSGGQYPAPVVVRTPYGGGIKGGHYHSQSPESLFVHTAGLQVVIPSNPADAKGLLTSAIRGEDPVIFLEPKRIYRTLKGEVPDGEHVVPIGEARVVKEGEDVTVVGYGAMLQECIAATDKAGKDGIDVELIDLRTLMPFDWDTIRRSVEKTGRVVIVHEAPRTCGFGAEIAALVAERSILHLEAPIRRVAGFDTPFPYTLEKLYMPDVPRVLEAIRETAQF